MPGLDPGIHLFNMDRFEAPDRRVKPGDDFES
jgi:hypothetical protein